MDSNILQIVRCINFNDSIVIVGQWLMLHESCSNGVNMNGVNKRKHVIYPSIIVMNIHLNFIIIIRLNIGNFETFNHSGFYLILSSRIGSVLEIIQNDSNIGHLV